MDDERGAVPPGAVGALVVHLRYPWERHTCVGRPHGIRVDIELENPTVSARHCLLLSSISRSGFLIVDQGSLNGTCLWVQGHVSGWARVPPAGLFGHWGAWVRAGGSNGTILRVEAPADILISAGA